MSSTSQRSVDPQTVSEVAHQEGGTTRGSSSAQLQSQLTKEKNAQEVEGQVASKLDRGIPPSHDEARLAESREHRATGRLPESGSVAAQAQSAADKHDSTHSLEQTVHHKLDLGAAPTKNEASSVESSEHEALGYGPESGSLASRAQSTADKASNFETVAAQVGDKVHNHPSSITSAEASALESREHKAMGYRPGPDSLSAEAKRLASANEKGQARPVQADKEHDFQQAAEMVKPKIDNDPQRVTEDDAQLLHSTDRRAHGNVEKGGITAQAQHLAAENKGDTA